MCPQYADGASNHKANAPRLKSAELCFPMRQMALWRWMRAQQYGQPGFAPHPPLHAFVYNEALRLSGARRELKHDVWCSHDQHTIAGVNVQLIWTPYEQVAHLLWHVAVRCETHQPASMETTSSTGSSSAGSGSGSGTDDTGATLPLPMPLVASHTADPSSVVWCELPSSPLSSQQQSIEASAITLDLPRSSRSLCEVLSARDGWRRSWRHTLYIPGVHDCRHHACTVLAYLYPPPATTQ